MRVERRKLPLPLPQRVQRPLVHAAARQRPPDGADRRRRRAARAARRGRRSIPLHPAERVDLVIDFRDYRPGHRARAAERRRPGRHGGDHALRRRRGGGSEDSRVPRRLQPLEPLPQPNASRRWDLALGTRRLGDQRHVFDPTASTSARDGHAPSAGPSSTTPTACTRCTCTASCSGCCRRAAAACIRPTGSAGRTRSACFRTRRSTVQAWFAPYGGRYVFHCHALEHADKAMMLQMEVQSMRRVLLAVAGAAGARRRRLGARRPDRCRPSTTHAATDWSPNKATVKAGETVTWTLHRHYARAQRPVRRGRGTTWTLAAHLRSTIRRSRTRSRRSATYHFRLRVPPRDARHRLRQRRGVVPGTPRRRR